MNRHLVFMNRHLVFMNRHLVFMNRHLVFITSKKPFNTKGYRIPKHVFKHYLNIYINSTPSKKKVLAPCKTAPNSNLTILKIMVEDLLADLSHKEKRQDKKE